LFVIGTYSIVGTRNVMKISSVFALGVVAVLFVVTAGPAQAATPGKAGIMPSRILAEGELPEPTSLSLLALGSVALLFRRRRH
jgi:hypothetical protein